MYIPTHRKRRDGWGTRSVVAGEILGFALRANAGVLRCAQNDTRCSEIEKLIEVGGGYGYCGDGGSFGAEDAGAEGDGLPGVLGEEGHLFRGPAAFGADGECMGGSVR